MFTKVFLTGFRSLCGDAGFYVAVQLGTGDTIFALHWPPGSREDQAWDSTAVSQLPQLHIPKKLTH